MAIFALFGKQQFIHALPYCFLTAILKFLFESVENVGFCEPCSIQNLHVEILMWDFSIFLFQVSDHLKAVAKDTDIRVVPIVGGMSMEKQERLLKGRPEIVVGTPGRLWELMSGGEKHLVEVSTEQRLTFA